MRLKPDRLIITGQRTFSVYNDQTKEFRLILVGEEVKIEISLPASKNADLAIPELLKSVFVTTPELENKCSPEEQRRFPELLSWVPNDKNKQVPAQASSLAEISLFCFPTGERAYRVGQGIHPPKAIKTPDPKYPERAHRLQSRVVLLIIVDQQGHPTTIYVSKPAGHGFDEQAIEAVQKWRFEPATFQGTAVPVAINIEINFRLY